jgi:diguanylate cyclase (GGDEF)-like protein/PAS domain S-box-containing protein
MMAKAWKLYLVFGLVAALTYSVMSPEVSKLVAWPAIGWSSVIAILVGVRHNRPSARAPWYLLALGLAMFIAGDDLYSFRNYVQHAEALFPSYVDILYLSIYPLFFAGLARMVHHRSAGRDRSGLVDAIVITAGIGLVAWVFLIAPYVRNTDLSMVERLVSIAYPLGDIALLAIAVRLAFGGGRRPAAFWWLAGSIVPLLVADALYGHLNLAGTWHEHNPIDVGWIAFYVGWGIAALHPSMKELTTATAVRRPVGAWRLLFVGSAVLVPPAVLFVEQARGTVSDAAAIAVVGAVMFVLVMIRIAGLARLVADERSEARFHSLIDNASDAIVVVDAAGVMRYHTPSTERVLGEASDKLKDRPLADLLERADAEELYLLLAGTINPTLVEWLVCHGDGTWHDLEVVVEDLRSVAGVDGFVLTVRDITDRKRLDAELRRQAQHDHLTGLPNRALFVDRVAEALERGLRSRSSVGVFILDLDDFRMVNDSLGHALADELLIAVGARLVGLHRGDVTIARLGGDEFGVVVGDDDVVSGLDAIARHLRDIFRRPFSVGGDQIHVRVSIGMAAGNADSSNAADLVRNADVAMYVAKRNGKDRIEKFEPSMYEAARRRLEIAGELYGAIERDELVLHYQPVVDLHTGRVLGAEALVRWQHPQRGLLPPSEFIPIAESSAVIVPLGRWVLSTACRQVADWKRAGVAEHGFYVTVNLSGRHVQDPGIVDDVRLALSWSQLAPSCLVLEVTETTLIQDLERTRTTLAEIKGLGVRLAVDDFGTGYSSLSYLSSFPLDIIKIDKSFVDQVAATPSGAAMVRAVVDLAKSLNLKAVAEGVEERGQAEALEALGCTLAQGFLYAKPLPVEAMALALDTQVDATPMTVTAG